MGRTFRGMGVILLVLCFSRSSVPEELPGGAVAQERFIDHGVAAAVSESRGAMATVDGAGVPLILVMALDTYKGAARTSLLVIDAQTGKTDQYWYPDKETPSPANYCLLLSSQNRLYVMSGDVFLEFDVDQRAWTFAKDLGLGTAMAMTEDEDGMVYAGTYPESQLVAFDPKTREVRHLGRLDAKEKYPSSLVTDGMGWIYAGIGTARSNIIGLRIETQELRQLVNESDRSTGSGVVYLAEDGRIYGRMPNQQIVKLWEGTAETVESAPPAAVEPSISWGQIHRAFPTGGEVLSFDLPGKTFQVEDMVGENVTLGFDYASEGAMITSLIAGPGNMVYGSTYHPFRFFSYDPAEGKLVNLGGLNAVGGGNFCGLAMLGNTVYGAEYPGGQLFAFDAAQPWNDAPDGKANPRARVSGLGYRVSAIAGDQGSGIRERDVVLVYPSCAGGNGSVGGGIACYDPESGETVLLAKVGLPEGYSIVTLKVLPDGNLVGGTSIDAPGGGAPTAKTGKLFIMDWAERRIIFDVEPVAGASEINCLAVGGDGRVYGLTSDARFFVFDSQKRVVVSEQTWQDHGQPLRPDQSLFFAEDGRLYALLSKNLLTVSTEDYETSVAAALPEPATAGLALRDGHVYYAVGSRLCSCRLARD